MRRVSAFVLACALALSLSACGSGVSSADTPSSSAAASSAASSDGGSFEKDEGFFNVTLTYPASFVGEDATQESLDQIVEESNGEIKSATLNEDGSATYVMSKSYYQESMQEMANSINESLAAMVGSEEYPNFTAVEANDNFTVFTVTTTSTELGLNEAFSVLGFYMYGGLYGTISGEQPENVHVDFVNAETGEIIESADSSDSGSED